ncbi:hypothetical protein COLO4_34367 [Corchorus olitorius]|uniref:Uncharacterized protein n=1 Tax=Corchorus olitorius TaxID=93759 RepID=A0A1R3GL86_9ROSI|nr:hypothetical protein COLO4_34367 [Corchorus olitorius]
MQFPSAADSFWLPPLSLSIPLSHNFRAPAWSSNELSSTFLQPWCVCLGSTACTLTIVDQCTGKKFHVSVSSEGTIKATGSEKLGGMALVSISAEGDRTISFIPIDRDMCTEMS